MGETSISSIARQRRNTFIADVINERRQQIHDWGASYDRHHTINDWVALITHHAAKVVVGEESQYQAMVDVAALAMACAERLLAGDGPAPRHYDDETEG